MKLVYPVRYKRRDIDEEGKYFIVAHDPSEAEEIAFSCIANDPPPRSAGPDRPASFGRKIADVWVQDGSGQPTECDMVGLICSSDRVAAKALALYVKENNKLH